MNRNATAIILIVLAIGIYFTFTQNIINQAQIEQAHNVQYTTAITNAENLISLRKQANDQFINIAPSDQARLSQMIPNGTNNIHLIVDLNNLAQKYNFSLSNIKADVVNATNNNNPSNQPVANQASAGTASLAQVKVTFSANASYGDFLNFLLAVESNLRIMDISKIDVKANDTGIYGFQVELRTYWLQS